MIDIWDVDDGGAFKQMLAGHTYYINSLAFSFDGKRLASGSYNHTIKTCDMENRGTEIGSVTDTDSVLSVDLNPDGTQLVWGSSDNTVKIWNVDNSGTLTLLGIAYLIHISFTFTIQDTPVLCGL